MESWNHVPKYCLNLHYKYEKKNIDVSDGNSHGQKKKEQQSVPLLEKSDTIAIIYWRTQNKSQSVHRL